MQRKAKITLFLGVAAGLGIAAAVVARKPPRAGEAPLTAPSALAPSIRLTGRPRVSTKERMITARLDPALSARIVESTALPGVRAGSALVEAGGRLLAAQDDAFTLMWIDPVTRALTPLVLEGTGAPLPKYKKPDFEAALVSGTGEAGAGTVYVLGSGSAPNRRSIARLDVLRGAAELISAGPLYDALERALGSTPNIEGAVRIAKVARLFHRGSGRTAGANATIDVPVEALDGAPPGELRAVRYDLGSIERIPLTFTDAAPLDGGRRALYLAVAEDTPDAIADGPILGAAVGVLEEEGARFALILEADGSPCARKPEGLALDKDGRSGYLLTDPDSPDVPAELCKFVLEGPW
jgi:hypothetical protein